MVEQLQALIQNQVQSQRVVQQPTRGRVHIRGGNRSGRGQRALSRGVIQTEAR